MRVKKGKEFIEEQRSTQKVMLLLFSSNRSGKEFVAPNLNGGQFFLSLFVDSALFPSADNYRLGRLEDNAMKIKRKERRRQETILPRYIFISIHSYFP